MVGERGDAMTKGIVRENLTSCRRGRTGERDQGRGR